MNKLSEERLLAELVQLQPGEASGNETDLGALAEHLSVIAEALRKSTRAPTDKSTAVLLRGARSTERPAEFTSNFCTAWPDPNAKPSSLAVHSDINVRRRHYGILAREAYAVRRRRTAIFESAELFGEPAWDILLDLYIAHAESKQVSVSSACIGSAAPPTTGLRWLGVLSEQGLVLREHDPQDQRRVLVRLTEKGLDAMDNYFASISPRA